MFAAPPRAAFNLANSLRPARHSTRGYDGFGIGPASSRTDVADRAAVYAQLSHLAGSISKPINGAPARSNARTRRCPSAKSDDSDRRAFVHARSPFDTAGYFGFMPAALASAVHRVTRCERSAEFRPASSETRSRRHWRAFPRRRQRRDFFAGGIELVDDASGVPAGAEQSYQIVASKPGMASASEVGPAAARFGFGDVTPMPRSVPPELRDRRSKKSAKEGRSRRRMTSVAAAVRPDTTPHHDMPRALAICAIDSASAPNHNRRLCSGGLWQFHELSEILRKIRLDGRTMAS